MAQCPLIGCWSYKRCNVCFASQQGNREGKKKYSWWGGSKDCEYEAGVRVAGEVNDKPEGVIKGITIYRDGSRKEQPLSLP